MFKDKFAVIKAVGNTETVLKFFDDKSSAVAYGENIRKTTNEGVICCIKGSFDENNNLKNNLCRVYEVWE